MAMTIRNVALTRDFKETVHDRVRHDPEFARELLREGLEAMRSGEIDQAEVVLRDYLRGLERRV
jgi:hypothetical protein